MTETTDKGRPIQPHRSGGGNGWHETVIEPQIPCKTVGQEALELWEKSQKEKLTTTPKLQPRDDLCRLDIAFGNVKHLPAWDDIPDEFKSRTNPHAQLCTRWFFQGLQHEDLIEKDGINRTHAIASVKAILMSFEPKHEHKIAGAAYLHSLWFDLPKKEKPNDQR